MIVIGSYSNAQHDHNSHPAHNQSDLIANEGQWLGNIDAYAATSNGGIYFSSDKMHFDLISAEDITRISKEIHASTGNIDQSVSAKPIRKHYYQVQLEGANSNIQPVFEGTKPNVYHFFKNDRATWRSDVNAYDQLRYNQVYPGVSVVYKMTGYELKYDFIVDKGADHRVIQLRYSAVDKLTIKNKQLVITTSVGEYREYIPLAYQEINGKSVEVECEYHLEHNVVSFVFPDGYNKKYPLIIDPQLIASTNSGSTAMIFGHTATFDTEGNVYVGGNGFDPGGLPTTQGAYQTTFGGANDMTINKYNPDGTQLIYSTYLGGSNMDLPHSFITDQNNELYVLGSTQSSDFPTTAQAVQSAFGGSTDICVSHFSADGGSLIGSSYYGGTDSDGINNIYANYGDTYRGEINLAENGDILIASFSYSSNFPVTASAFQGTLGGGQDGIVARFTSDLTVAEFATFIGGNAEDACYGILEAADGTICFSGTLGSNALTFPGNPAEPQYSSSNGKEAFVARIGANGQNIVNGTYIGNYGGSQGFFIQENSDNHVLVLVQSDNGIPSTPGKYQGPGDKISIIQYTEDFSQREWVSSTENSSPSAFMVDNCNRIYFSGHSGSGEVTPDALYNAQMGFYLMQLNETATTLVYGTYYGNGGSHVDGGTSRFDKNGVVYQATCSSGSFPAGPSGHYSDNVNSSYDMTVFKIDFEPNPQPINLPDQEIYVCDELPQAVTFDGTDAENVIHHWWFGDGGTSSEEDPTHSFTTYGVFEVEYFPEFQGGCSVSDTVTATVHIIEPEPFVLDYTLTQSSCNDTLFLAFDFTGTADSIAWNMGGGIAFNSQDPLEFYYETPGSYTITLYAEDTICSLNSTETIQLEHQGLQGVEGLYMPNIFTNNSDGTNDFFHLSADGHSVGEIFEGLSHYSLIILNRWGNPVFESDPEDTNTWLWDGKVNGVLLEEGVYFYHIKYKSVCMTDFEEKDGFVQIIR